MFKKILTIAIVVTLVAALPAWFISTLEARSGTAFIATLLLFVFCGSFVSALLAAKKTASRRRKPARQRSTSSGLKREAGSVKWFNASKGFGFITRDSGDDIFVHFRSIRGEGHRVLRDGQRVEFAITQGDKGLQADDVAAAG